ncbi:MAG: hypothetical protein R3C19_10880 [Planctomycetaceae bacterium]
MNLLLRMIRGPQVGSCRVLQIGQSALIGSSELCDFSVAPAMMGNPQFLVRCTQDSCTVQNVFPAVKLKVNGVGTTQKQLSDGDVIGVGDCEFIVKIRGLVSRLQKLRIPLVGTAEFTQEFSQTLNARRPDHTIRETTRATIHPSFWSDSVRMRHRGAGVPSESVVRACCGQRTASVIVDTDAVSQISLLQKDLARRKDLCPILAANDNATLCILDGLSESERTAVLHELWPSGSAMLVIAVDPSATCRDNLLRSSLWQNRTVTQVSQTLLKGSLALREGVFRYLDLILLPTDSGWLLLSSTRLQPLDEMAAAAVSN